MRKPPPKAGPHVPLRGSSRGPHRAIADAKLLTFITNGDRLSDKRRLRSQCAHVEEGVVRVLVIQRRALNATAELI